MKTTKTIWFNVYQEGNKIILGNQHQTYEEAWAKACTMLGQTYMGPHSVCVEIEEPPTKTKKVALYAYRTVGRDVYISSVLVTEAQAKRACERNNEWQLIKWPYGDVLEVEDV